VSVLQSLRLIFWGALVVVIYFQFGSDFDLLNNVLGYAIAAMGMIGLVKASVGGRYGWLLKLIAIVALLDAFWAPFVEGPSRMPLVQKIVSAALDVANPFAATGFCVVMRRFCETMPWERVRRSWRTSLSLWMIGLPASVGETCLGWWAVRNERGVISADNTPILLLAPIVVLALITIMVWIHTFISLGRTVAGLKGMVRQLPAADAFGLDQGLSFQFSIRALMIVTAATAVVAAGVSQATIPYWQFTMAGLVGLGLLASWSNHQTLAKGLLIGVAIVLFGGYSRIAPHSLKSLAYGVYGAPTANSSSDHLAPDPVLADIEAWLTARGFHRSAPPPDLPSWLSAAGAHISGPKQTTWYKTQTPQSQPVNVSVEYSDNGQGQLSLQVTYTSSLTDFPWVIQAHERQVERLRKEMRDWLSQYFDRRLESHSKP
jgi:hypothetical protein